MSILFVLLTFIIVMTVNYFYFRTPAPLPAELEVLARPKVPIMSKEHGFTIPKDYGFHPGHTWVMREGDDNARVGLDSFAADLIGKIEHMDIISPGRWVRQGQPLVHLQAAGVSFDLLSPVEGQPVLKDLSISIPFGSRVLISGSNETGKLTLFRATAGLWPSGKGRIIRPAATDIYFLAERPYLPPGTLREVLVDQKLEHSIADGQIRDLLHELDLDPVLVRAGGLNIEQDWGTLLSLGEQQLLAFVHILLAAPNFVFLDRAGTALNPGQLRKILKMLSKNSITYINIGESDDLRDLYDAVLEIDELGTWRWRQISAEPAN